MRPLLWPKPMHLNRPSSRTTLFAVTAAASPRPALEKGVRRTWGYASGQPLAVGAFDGGVVIKP